jgi:hypothetical protein
MPMVEIYRSGEKMASKEFVAQFFIIKEADSDTLRWEADKEVGKLKRGGTFHIWIQTIDYETPRQEILFVRPDWRLIIDGIAMEQKLYSEVDVGGRTIELQYGDYSFICSFPTTETELANTTAKSDLQMKH